MTKCISLHYKEKDASSDQAGARKQARAGKHAEGSADAVSGATQNGSGQNGSQARPEGSEGGRMQGRPQGGGKSKIMAGTRRREEGSSDENL